MKPAVAAKVVSVSIFVLRKKLFESLALSTVFETVATHFLYHSCMEYIFYFFISSAMKNGT